MEKSIRCEHCYRTYESAHDYMHHECSKYDKEYVVKTEELVKTMADLVNGSKIVSDKLTDTLRNTHRTLQQSIFSDIIIPMIKHWASLGILQHDLRNEDTVKICKEIVMKVECLATRFI